MNSRPGIAIYNPDLRHQKTGGRQSQTAHPEDDLRGDAYPSSRRGLKCSSNNSALQNSNQQQMIMTSATTTSSKAKKLNSLRNPSFGNNLSNNKLSSNLITIRNNNREQ